MQSLAPAHYLRLIKHNETRCARPLIMTERCPRVAGAAAWTSGLFEVVSCDVLFSKTVDPRIRVNDRSKV